MSLRELPKAETEPAAVSKAKSAAEEKGAKGVGALDTDNYASLDAGSYLIYSGVYEGKKAAREALAVLKKDFPKASVARIDENAKERGDEKAFSGKKEAATVDRKQLKELQDLSSEEYSKRSAKVPNQTKIPARLPRSRRRGPTSRTPSNERFAPRYDRPSAGATANPTVHRSRRLS